jgi:hypothetical protein
VLDTVKLIITTSVLKVRLSIIPRTMHAMEATISVSGTSMKMLEQLLPLIIVATLVQSGLANHKPQIALKDRSPTTTE